MTSTDTFYFGYGSNLDLVDFNDWCRGRFSNARLTPVTTGWMIDWKMQFHYYSKSRGGGAADIVPMVTRGFAVPGVLFHCNEEAWQALDRKEGHPRCYKRVAVRAATSRLQVVDAVTYVCTKQSIQPRFVKPTPYYANIIADSLVKFGLPNDMVRVSREQWIQPNDPSNIRHVFVYGTLRKGELREKHMHRENLLGSQRGSVVAKLFDLGSYPGMKPLSENPAVQPKEIESPPRVIGEAYEYSGNLDDVLRILDDIEGFRRPHDGNDEPTLYERVVAEVYLAESKISVWAWTYVYNFDAEAKSLIEGGDWVAHSAAPSQDS